MPSQDIADMPYVSIFMRQNKDPRRPLYILSEIKKSLDDTIMPDLEHIVKMILMIWNI